MDRLNYQESFQRAKGLVELIGNPNPDVSARPRHDEDHGPAIFRCRLHDCDLGFLTLYGLLIGRSELQKVNFRGADLHLSTFCWNDFIECDFSEADLSQSDLRASMFDSCSFRNANLEGCDLRHSKWEKCDFSGARMSGAILARGQQPTLKLSMDQRNGIQWKLLPGEEPEGG